MTDEVNAKIEQLMKQKAEQHNRVLFIYQGVLGMTPDEWSDQSKELYELQESQASIEQEVKALLFEAWLDGYRLHHPETAAAESDRQARARLWDQNDEYYYGLMFGNESPIDPNDTQEVEVIIPESEIRNEDQS